MACKIEWLREQTTTGAAKLIKIVLFRPQVSEINIDIDVHNNLRSPLGLAGQHIRQYLWRKQASLSSCMVLSEHHPKQRSLLKKRANTAKQFQGSPALEVHCRLDGIRTVVSVQYDLLYLRKKMWELGVLQLPGPFCCRGG